MLMAFSVVFFVLLYKRRMLENQLNVQEMESQHQQEMLSATLRSQEMERSRLGTELHDSVGAMLSSIKVNLQVARKSGNIENIGNVLGYLDDTIGQVRSISHQMMPILLKKYGLKKATEDLLEKISTHDMSANIHEWDNTYKGSEEQELMLFRITQELCNNSLKHAKAESISISLKRKSDGFNFQYKDDGIGFPSEILENAQGMGLFNIRNRAQTIGAKVTFSNDSGGGAHVNLLLGTSSA